ncbi:restriction endonuclease subunit S [Mesorhizobium qingshengii]|uniref:Restriction endonuclease subunit S n=1 Tax=Mesorhizobium qingshengii TaxID=1165689 RepID=A0ABT4R0I5_9HYPH|nr:restriction endonuclease subunit S [Mesorhizobium qingshengii]MCZ8547310.1 restriction endonuclease subunit S [Mesorhizobium qingshengii]
MSQLPNGWSPEVLGKLVDFIMGQAPPGADCNKSGVGTPFVKAGEFGSDRPLIREWTVRPLKHALSSDVLICVVGATAGKINLGADCAIGRSVAAIRPTEALDQRFLYDFLATKVLDLRAGSTGSAQGVIGKDDLAEIEIRLPPVPEQRRIVAKIDSLTGKSKHARHHLDHVLRLVERYKQAVLAAAFRGDLTSGWRAGRTSVAWQHVPWEDAGTTLNGRAFPSGDYATKGVKLLRPGNLHKSGRVEWNEKNTRFLPRSYAQQHPEHLIRGCEIVVNLTAQSLEDQFLARVCLSSETDEFLLNQRIALFRPHLMDRNYCLYALKAPDFRAFVDNGLNSGSLIQHVHTKQLKRFVFHIAPQDEQREIVRRIETAFNWIDRLADEATSASKLIDHLDQAVLAKAFRGELVPQDPADEPASLLLERIRAERGAAPKARRGRRKLNDRARL